MLSRSVFLDLPDVLLLEQIPDPEPVTMVQTPGSSLPRRTLCLQILPGAGVGGGGGGGGRINKNGGEDVCR